MKLKDKEIILILGASGYIGNALYKELLPYFQVYGTYHSQESQFGKNQVFSKFDVSEDDIRPLLDKIQPTVVISALSGNFKQQFHTHKTLAKYVKSNHNCKLLYFSSASVFDGAVELPSYENDRPMAESEYGRFKYSVEKLLKEHIPAQLAILRLPIVLGVNSPRMIQLRQAIKHEAAFEAYPNLIISVTTADKVAQQVHYVINKSLDGTFHLASNDMVHHEDLFKEIAEKLGDEIPIFKSVYRRNDDSYLAILPKQNLLPPSYRITVAEVIDASTLNEDILTIKK